MAIQSCVSCVYEREGALFFFWFASSPSAHRNDEGGTQQALRFLSEATGQQALRFLK